MGITKVTFLLVIVFITASCKNTTDDKSAEDIVSIEKGKVLASQYCQSCHQLPDPSWANKRTWDKGILPNMGPLLGIFSYQSETYPSSRFDRSLEANYYPSSPIISKEDWQNIIDYYVASSPESIEAPKSKFPKISKTCDQFSSNIPSTNDSAPTTCLVKINEADTKKRLIIFSELKHTLYTFNSNLSIVDSIKIKGAIVDVEINKNEWIMCNIGLMNPNNGKFGRVQQLVRTEELTQKKEPVVLFDKLARPVQTVAADLNKDKREDYITCEFGFRKGYLSWMENKGNGNFTRHVIKDYAGAIRAYVNDYNKDGLEDIWVLFTQEKEGIYLFTNKGKGEFFEEQLLSFPPIYGSSYFELCDFNEDGFLDIVYSCGDNNDYSIMLKPFHGVYIFLNNGKNQFSQKFFFPINGCYKVLARDFDNDGDFDLAAISFFADFQNRPEEGFVYLENKGNFVFHPYSLPEAQLGRWLTMDAGDIDGDGYIDIVLGNFSRGESFIKSKTNWKKGPPFIVLKNVGKQRAK